MADMDRMIAEFPCQTVETTHIFTHEITYEQQFFW